MSRGEEIVTISTSSPVRRFEPEEIFIEAETHSDQGISVGLSRLAGRKYKQIQADSSNNTYLGNKLIIGLIAGVCALTLLLLNAVGLIIFRRNNAKLADGIH